jgi:hypothetical protein
MRLYIFAAVAVLAASSFAFFFLDDDAGPILTVAGVLFWVSGVALIALLTYALGQRLGISWRRPGPDDTD